MISFNGIAIFISFTIVITLSLNCYYFQFLVSISQLTDEQLLRYALNKPFLVLVL